MYMYYDLPYIVIALISLVLGALTQGYINSAYNKWSQVPTSLSGSGADVARRMEREGATPELLRTLAREELDENANWYACQKDGVPELAL